MAIIWTCRSLPGCARNPLVRRSRNAAMCSSGGSCQTLPPAETVPCSLEMFQLAGDSLRLILTGLQVRGIAGGAAATVNWLTNALVAQTFLTLTQWLGASGAFWLYALIALAGLAWVYRTLPETSGTAHAMLPCSILLLMS